MKITFVCPPLTMTGGIRVIAIYAKYLQQFGHDVCIVASPAADKGLLGRILRRLGLPPAAARRQPASHVDGTGVPTKIIGRPRPIVASDVPDADVIIATWWATAEFIAPMPPSKGRKVYFVQGHEVFSNLPRDRVVATYRSGLKKITIAQWLVDAIARDGNTQPCVVVPNAVDHGQFFAPARAKSRRPRLGTLFSENTNKSFDIALAVIAAIRERLPDLEVVAFGERPPVQYADRLDGIALTLHPQQDVLRDIYASCDVWLCCSKSEGFNLIAMEAMACRTPVVSTRTGWPEEAIVAGVNGALADVDDVAGLAQAALDILSLDGARWEALSDGAARTVADSSWERSARLFEAALMPDVAATSR